MINRLAMVRFVFTISVLISIIACFGFFTNKPTTAAQQVKQLYLQHTSSFIDESKKLQAAVESGNQKKMQQQFFKTRAAYKHMETIFAYYFQSYVNNVNSSPKPYFEEEELDVPVQKAAGMQVIEEMIFADYSKTDKAKLKSETAELVRMAVLLPTINEPIAFYDNNNFDAFVEELYRITALGIAGFDSPTTVNSLPECKEALTGLQQYISIYKNEFDKKLPGKFIQLNKLFDGAKKYLDKNRDFIAFDRMFFIINYLDPITKIAGSYKQIGRASCRERV